MNTKIPAVSIMMPVYNREEMVVDAVRSIQKQTLEDWELIILNDGSTDATELVCRTLAAEDPRIQVHNNSANLGCGESRNRLISLAKADLLAFQDSDDTSVPQRLEIEMNFLKAHNEVGLVSGVAALLDDSDAVFRYYPEHLRNGVPYPQEKKEMVKRLFLGECSIAIPTCMFRAAILKSLPRPFGDFRITDDRYFFLQIARHTGIWGMPDVLVHMRRGNAHQHLWKDTLGGIREISKCLNLFYRQQNGNGYITRAVYRKAIAASMLWEAQYFGGVQGWPMLLKSLTYSPLNRRAWSTLLQFSKRGLKKIATGHPVQE